MTYGYVTNAMRNSRLKTKYVKFDDFTTVAGAICAAIILLGTFVFLSAFADHETRYVAMFDEPCMMDGDEYGQLKLCYVPFKVVIDAGSVVMWENVGHQVHTVTSGTILSPANHFNSGLVTPNNFYSLEFAVEGIYPYYCMVHPWMNGSIVVSEKLTEDEEEERSVIIAEFDLEEGEVVILEDGMFTNSTGTFYANGTAVIPEFPVAIIVLVTAVTVMIVTQRSLTRW